MFGEQELEKLAERQKSLMECLTTSELGYSLMMSLLCRITSLLKELPELELKEHTDFCGGRNTYEHEE